MPMFILPVTYHGPSVLMSAAIEALGVALESLPHGLQHLVLANCKISNKGEGL